MPPSAPPRSLDVQSSEAPRASAAKRPGASRACCARSLARAKASARLRSGAACCNLQPVLMKEQSTPAAPRCRMSTCETQRMTRSSRDASTLRQRKSVAGPADAPGRAGTASAVRRTPGSASARQASTPQSAPTSPARRCCTRRPRCRVSADALRGPASASSRCLSTPDRRRRPGGYPGWRTRCSQRRSSRPT
jgi:hypothetical protein